MIKFISSELKAAVKKMKGFSGETYVLTCFKGEDKDGKFRAELDASNGVAQAMVALSYEASEAIELRLVVGTEFAGVIDTLSAFGDVIELEVRNDTVSVSCGTASLSIPMQKEEVCMTIDDFKKDTVRMTIEREALLSLITQGGFAFSDSPERPSLYQTVYLLPEANGEERTLRASSSNGFIIATATAQCDVKTDDVFTEWATAGKGALVKVNSLLSLVRRLIEDRVIMYISNNQLLIRDGNDVYCFVCINDRMPMKFIEVVTQRGELEYNFSVAKSELKAAVNVSGLFNKDGKIKLKRKEDGGLTISNESGDGAATVETVGDGAVERSLNLLYLVKTMDSLLGDEIRMSGSKGGAGMYFSSTDGTADALIMPIA